MNFLITGSSGFIGFHLSKHLLNKGHKVIGVDSNFRDEGYKNKIKRLKILKKFKKFNFHKLNKNKDFSKKKFQNINFLIHLAAQPGVRISLIRPKECVQNNILAFTEVIEFVRKNKIKNFLYASSSTVYGERNKNFSENEITTDPKSLYAISKICNEITAKFYFKNFNINSIGIRFFSIYGPFGRKDMSYYKFLDDINKNGTVYINGNGNIKRSFTHIDDTIICLDKLIFKFYKKKNYNEIFNIGNESTISINKVVSLIKNFSKKKFKVIKRKKLRVDNNMTKANTKKIFRATGYKPKIKFLNGLEQFIKWYDQNK